MSPVQHAAHRATEAVLRRMLQAIGGLLLLFALIALGVQVWTARETLRLHSTQLSGRLVQRAVAQIERQGLVGTRRDALLQSLFEEQNLQRVELIDERGQVLFTRQVPPNRLDLVTAMDLALRPHALTSEWPVRLKGADAPAGLLRTEVAAPDLGDLAGRALLQSVAGLVLGLLLVGAVAFLALRGMRKSVNQLGMRLTEAAAAAARPPPSRVDGAELTHEVARLQVELKRRAAELEQLRQAALVDPLTGLQRREHFLAQLALALEGEGAWPVGTLLLLRVRDLEGLNRRAGHAAVNQLLQGLGRKLSALLAADQSTGGLAGRLNGADFAALLPGTASASRKARMALSVGRELMKGLDPEGGLVVAAVDLKVGTTLAQAMALADESLAEAMAGEPFAMVVGKPSPNHVAHGEARWQQMLTDALAHRRARLAEYPVCDAEGRLLYLDCPLRVQCVLGGVYEGARRWLAPAQRSQFHAEFDLLAIQLTLEAIMRDGRERCTNVSVRSMASTDFMARVTGELERLPQGARGLWLDLPEAMAVEHPALVHEASRRWRPLGVRLALEHAGERLAQVQNLPHLGLDAVRLSGALVAGLRGPEPAKVREHLHVLVRFVHESGLKATAEAVSGTAELAAVWALGFDAATGPSVRPRKAPPEPAQSEPGRA